MKPQNAKFADTWVNQTKLGQHFGLSAVALGKKLIDLGLRTPDKTPTEQALAEGYCRPAPLRDGTPFFLWNMPKVSGLMRAHGIEELSASEREAYEWAKAIVEIENRPDDGLAHKIFDLLLDDIPARAYPAINSQLKKLGSDATLGE